MNGKLHYSAFFGYAASKLRRRGLASPCNGVIAQINPKIGKPNVDLIYLSKENGLISTALAIDTRKCVGSTISNRRLFYTAQASGL